MSGRKKASNGMVVCECPVPRSRKDATDERRRHPDLCGNPGCLGYIDPEWTLNDETIAEFFDHVEQGSHDGSVARTREHAIRREAAVRERFGHSFLGKDCIAEALEEGADGPLWILAEVLKRRRAGQVDDDIELAYMAALCFAQAHEYARRYQASDVPQISDYDMT